MQFGVNLEKIHIKRYSLQTIVLLLWVLNEVVLIGARFMLVRFEIYGFMRECILWAIPSFAFLVFICYAGQVKRRDIMPFLVIYLCAILAFLITYIVHPEYSYFFTRTDYGLLRVFRPDCAIYALFFFSLFDDVDELIDNVKRIAYIYMGYLIALEYIPRLIRGYWPDTDYLGNVVERAYSLSFGYAILLPTIIFLYFFFKEKRILYLALSAIGAFIIFTQGSRGALLMVAIFVVLMAISAIREIENRSKQIYVIVGLVLFAVICVTCGGFILQGMGSMLQGMGIQSRTLEMLASGEITNDTGRSIIWDGVIAGIKEGGILGNGAFGDRPYVFPLHYAAYSHNLFLELICSFGLIGVMISIGIVLLTIYMVFKCDDRKWRELFIIFFSVSCQLMLSMSFWYVFEFWATLAIGLKYIQIKKEKSLESKRRNNG